jgi:hypothetical protein
MYFPACRRAGSSSCSSSSSSAGPHRRSAPEHASFLGRYAGGIFIYALSIIDAYKIARVK